MDIVSSDTQLRSKRQLIEKFIQKNMPFIKPDEDVGQRIQGILGAGKRKHIIRYLCGRRIGPGKNSTSWSIISISAGQNPLRDDIVAALKVQPKILERRKVVNRVLEHLIGFIRTFEDDLGEV